MTELRRINRGRGHSYTLDGQPIPGATTVLSKAYAKPALVDWSARVTAGYAVDHWDELAEKPLSERLRILEKSRYESLTQASVRGTDIHALAHRLAAGEEVTPPEDQLGYVDAYLQFVTDWQPQEIVVEAPIVHTRWRYGGTLDLIAKLADGNTWLLDWKTGGKGIFPEAALQLAAYRYADLCLNSDGKLVRMPPIDRAGAVWLQADGYQLIPVDTSDRIFNTFLYALGVYRFVDAFADTVIGEALTAPEGAAAT